jgi:hypothetical protein
LTGDRGQTPHLRHIKFDPRRGHEHTMHKIGGRWRRTVEQDGHVFDRDTGEWIEVL